MNIGELVNILGYEHGNQFLGYEKALRLFLIYVFKFLPLF